MKTRLLFALLFLFFSCVSKPLEQKKVEYPPPPPPVVKVEMPSLKVISINILKDELVVTKLKLNVEIHNPNSFAIICKGLEYKLYGEGQYWASGTTSEIVAIEPNSQNNLELFLTMNFADMDRALLDKVIYLATINYKLIGVLSFTSPHTENMSLPFAIASTTKVLR